MKLMVIDGNSIVNRAYYGIRPLSTRDGLYTHAIYGFLTPLQRLLDEEQPEALCRGFAGSLLTLAARENGTLVGLLRAVGDGCTVVLVQDLLVRPDHQRRGIGTALMQAALERFRSVRQVQLLTDDTEKTKGFYRSLGLLTLPELGCCGFMRP